MLAKKPILWVVLTVVYMSIGNLSQAATQTLYVDVSNASNTENGTQVYLSLSAEKQQKLNQYASATVRYFTSPNVNNKLVGFPHAFFGTGDTGQWRECDAHGSCTPPPWPLTRGYGAHVNINEVTLRLLSLATAYKMDWLTYLPEYQRYAETWGQILTALRTMDTMQTSGNTMQFTQGHFHRTYLTTIVRNNIYDLDRMATEIERPANENTQSSDDNALPFMNLLILEGLAKDTSISIPDSNIIVSLCQLIRSRIKLRDFVNTQNEIAFNFIAGVLSSGVWDRISAEGPVILSALLLSRQITVQEFYAIAPSLKKTPVYWSTTSRRFIYIDKPSYHSAMFIHSLRAIHGMPVSNQEFPGLNFFETSVKPILEAQIDYADYYGMKGLGTQVMTQLLAGYPLFSNQDGTQVQFPGNEANRMPIRGITPSRGTGSHAWFVPLTRWRSLSQSQIGWIFRRAAEYESEFFHAGSDTLLGWEAAIPWKLNDTTYTWVGNGRTNYTDWGRPYEALNTAYIVLSIFDALSPDKPLASYSVEAERMKHIAQYFDTGILLPSKLFP